MMEQKDTERHRRIRIAVELEPTVVARIDQERQLSGCTRAQYLRTLVMERVGPMKRFVANGR